MQIETIETPQLKFAVEEAEFWIPQLGPRTRAKLEKIKEEINKRFDIIHSTFFFIFY